MSEEQAPSSDVTSLMERCWRQDPAERPQGFGPVIQTLSNVVARVGDPRGHSTATTHVASPSCLEITCDDPSVEARTVPLSSSGGVDASSSLASASSQATGADSGVAAHLSVKAPLTETGVESIENTPVDMPWCATKTTARTALPAVAVRVAFPSIDPQIAKIGPPPSNRNSGGLPILTKTSNRPSNSRVSTVFVC